MSYTLNKTGEQIDAILARAAEGGAIDAAIAAKQDVLTFDDAPTEGSNNPVKSGGILTAIERGTVDTARAVLSNEKTTDTAPFLYRLNPYGNRVKPCIVGVSVGANQLVQLTDGTATNAHVTMVRSRANGTITFSGTAAAAISGENEFASISVPAGNKVYIGGVPSSADGKVYIRVGSIGGSFLVACRSGGVIVSSTTGISLSLSITNGANCDGIVMKPVLINLSLRYGTAIADAAYTKEQATAGSGIAWLRSYGLLPEAYEAYNAGSIKSVNTSGRKTVGVNQWDEETELGLYDQATGEPIASTQNFRTVNPIRVPEDKKLYFRIQSHTVRVFWYGILGDYINNQVLNGSQLVTAPAQAEYARFQYTPSPLVYSNDISINYPSTDTAYHAYETVTYPTESTDLRGIFKLDGDTIYADGDLYPPSGDGTRKYGIVNMGTINYVYDSTNAYFYTTVITRKYGANIVCLSDMYSDLGDKSGAEMASVANLSMASNNNNVTIKFKNTAYSDAAAFKTAMSGVYLVYELATPTTLSLDPYTEIQQALTTEEWLGSEVPVGQNSEYYKDIVSAIEGIPEAPSANGTYTLKVTVSGGVATYSWESDGVSLSMSSPSLSSVLASPSVIAEPGLEPAELDEPAEEPEEVTEEADEPTEQAEEE